MVDVIKEAPDIGLHDPAIGSAVESLREFPAGLACANPSAVSDALVVKIRFPDRFQEHLDGLLHNLVFQHRYAKRPHFIAAGFGDPVALDAGDAVTPLLQALFQFGQTLDEKLLPAKVRRQLPALIDGGFVERSVNVLAFGLPGRGKTHFLAALGRELILRHGKRVLFRPAFKLVGKLLAAKRDLRLEAELKKLDRYDVLILDDIGYVQQSREEMEVLFTHLAERYDRRSLLISSNLVFSQWDQIFKDPLTTMAAIDRLVHHSIILEFDGASQRVKKAAESLDKPAG